jgi:hypothetical protein
LQKVIPVTAAQDCGSFLKKKHEKTAAGVSNASAIFLPDML